MKVKAIMAAYAEGAERDIEIPDAEAAGQGTDGLLDLAFRYGQNDFQPRLFTSVSVGDVIQLEAGNYRVLAMGFSRLPDGADPRALKGQAAILFAFEVAQ